MLSQDADDFGFRKECPQHNEGGRHQRANKIRPVKSSDLVNGFERDWSFGKALENEENERKDREPKFARFEKWFGIHVCASEKVTSEWWVICEGGERVEWTGLRVLRRG